MININLNGKTTQIQSDLTLDQLLKGYHYPVGSFAVAINETFVPRSCYVETIVKSGDHIEIVTAMQGG